MSATTPSDTTAKIGADWGRARTARRSCASGRSAASSPRTSIPLPTSRLPMTHAFDELVDDEHRRWRSPRTATQRATDGPRQLPAAVVAGGVGRRRPPRPRRSPSSTARPRGARLRVRAPSSRQLPSPARRSAIRASPASRRTDATGMPAGGASRRSSSASVSRGHGLEVRLDRGRDAVDPQHDPVVEVQLRLLAQVLDRALELAGVALGAQLGRQLGVEHDDEPVAVGDRGARSRASPGSRPRRPRASRRPASPSRRRGTRPRPRGRPP